MRCPWAIVSRPRTIISMPSTITASSMPGPIRGPTARMSPGGRAATLRPRPPASVLGAGSRVKRPPLPGPESSLGRRRPPTPSRRRRRHGNRRPRPGAGPRRIRRKSRSLRPGRARTASRPRPERPRPEQSCARRPARSVVPAGAGFFEPNSHAPVRGDDPLASSKATRSWASFSSRISIREVRLGPPFGRPGVEGGGAVGEGKAAVVGQALAPGKRARCYAWGLGTCLTRALRRPLRPFRPTPYPSRRRVTYINALFTVGR